MYMYMCIDIISKYSPACPNAYAIVSCIFISLFISSSVYLVCKQT